MRTLLLFTLSFLLFLHNSIAQVSQSPEKRVEAIRAAAVKIWKLQREEGNGKATAESNECRERLLKTKATYDDEVEECLVIDYFVSMSTASFYAQLSEEYRKSKGIDVEKLRLDAAKRIASAHALFKLSPAEASEAAKLLRENVFQAVLAAAAAK